MNCADKFDARSRQCALGRKFPRVIIVATWAQILPSGQRVTPWAYEFNPRLQIQPSARGLTQAKLIDLGATICAGCNATIAVAPGSYAAPKFVSLFWVTNSGETAFRVGRVRCVRAPHDWRCGTDEHLPAVALASGTPQSRLIISAHNPHRPPNYAPASVALPRSRSQRFLWSAPGHL